MYHLRLKGDHYQMGVKRGKIFQKAISHFLCILMIFNLSMEEKANRY